MKHRIASIFAIGVVVLMVIYWAATGHTRLQFDDVMSFFEWL
ncbi:hypothetical protein OF122_12260 [Pelagibacterium flavum]|uniref:Uncharacterized protein n=1 Tax=Pelagibacterium flavum TaxID=2984530 RepID=A0ABY6IJQ0_9HYPH|nr:hypothetical protein [Pelagibacterium sp. YIM 151497]UYQ70836.1 hypothetical protein OF122_12260 [Pelagibacterium sp. YIM 151497]